MRIEREQNFFEVMNLRPSATQEMIDDSFAALKTEDLTQKQKMAFECLKEPVCRADYIRFGGYISFDNIQNDLVEFDWRLAMTIVFYIMFAFVQGVLSSKEQKPGLRASMGLGIIFCITELQLLTDVRAVIVDGKPADPRIISLQSIFPKNYCAFEQVLLLRLLFFLAFGLINSYSLCFVVSDEDQ